MPPAAAEWFYVKDSQECGPVSWNVLLRLAETGELRRADLVYREGMDEWAMASRVGGLTFPPAAPVEPTVTPDGQGQAANDEPRVREYEQFTFSTDPGKWLDNFFSGLTRIAGAWVWRTLTVLLILSFAFLFFRYLFLAPKHDVDDFQLLIQPHPTVATETHKVDIIYDGEKPLSSATATVYIRLGNGTTEKRKLYEAIWTKGEFVSFDVETGTSIQRVWIDGRARIEGNKVGLVGSFSTD
jgi:hypothetical protein